MKESVDVFLHKTPFFRVVLPFVFGISAGVLADVGSVPVCILLVFLLPVILMPFTKTMSYGLRWLYGFALTVSFFILGLFCVSQKKSVSDVAFSCDADSLYIATVKNTPRERKSSVEFVVEAKKYDDGHSSSQCAYKIVCYAEKDSKTLALNKGDVFLFRNGSALGMEDPLGAKNTYFGMLGVEQAVYVRSKDIVLVDRNDAWGLIAVAERLRRHLLVYYNERIQGDEFSVLSALVLGDKSQLNPRLRDAYSVAGASHVLAVSGLHVGIVYLFADFIFSFFLCISKLKRFRFAAVLLVLWVYSFVTGLSPSVVRASAMLTILLVGKMVGRTGSFYNTISVAAFFMLLYNPMYVKDIGFQLSFAAVLSIVFFHEKIVSKFKIKNFIFSKLWSMTAVTISAQIGTLPLILYYFGTLPLLSFFTSLYVVPASAVVICLSFALLAFSPFQAVADMLGLFLQYVLKTMNAMVCFVADTPNSYIEIRRFDEFCLVMLYLLIAFVSIYFVFYRKLLILHLSLIVSIVLFSYSLYDRIFVLPRFCYLVVHNIKGYGVVNFIAGKNNFVLTCSDEPDVSDKLKWFWKRHRLDSPTFISEPGLSNENLSIYYLNDKNRTEGCFVGEKLGVDYLVVGAGAGVSFEEILQMFDFKCLIFDSTVRGGYKSSLKRDARREGVKDIFFVSDEGDYVKCIE